MYKNNPVALKTIMRFWSKENICSYPNRTLAFGYQVQKINLGKIPKEDCVWMLLNNERETTMSLSFDDDGGRLQKQGYNQKEPAWDANIKWFQFPDGDTSIYYYRLVARPTFYATHWIATKKADGTAGKSYPVLCCDYDSKNNRYVDKDQAKCVICDFMNQAYKLAPLVEGKDGKKQKSLPDHIKKMNSRLTMAHNAIIREIQQQGAPQNNTGGWSFIHPIRLPQGTANMLVEKEERFGHKFQDKDAEGKFFTRTAGFSHAIHGKDVAISFNSKLDAQKMYQIDVGPKDPTTPLTDEEKAHRGHLIDFAAAMKYPTASALQQTLEKNGLYDYLNQLTAMANLKTVSKAVTQQAAAAPVAAPVVNNQIDPEFDDQGGLAVHQLGESQQTASSNDNNSGILNQNQPVEDDVPDFPPLAATPPVETKAPVQQHAPKVEVAAAPAAPVTTPVAQAPVAPPQVAAAKPAAGGDVTTKLTAFSQSSGVELIVDNSTYDKVRLYKAGMAVPKCFKTYLVTSKSAGICKGCPLRMDCMMVSPAQIPSAAAAQPTVQG